MCKLLHSYATPFAVPIFKLRNLEKEFNRWKLFIWKRSLFKYKLIEDNDYTCWEINGFHSK